MSICVRVLGGLVLGLLGAGCVQASDEDLLRKLQTRADSGNAAAQYNLGMLYNNGIGTTKDPKVAFHWFERSAKSGDLLGSYKVGCYYAGQFDGVVMPNAGMALTYKLAAAQAGYVLAQHDVGIVYAERGNHVEAAKWWQAAAEQGDVAALVMLADAYQRGIGVVLDPVKSYEYLLIASRLVPADQALRAKPMIDNLREGLDREATANAEKRAAAWVPKPSDLTIRARQGIEEAKRIAQ